MKRTMYPPNQPLDLGLGIEDTCVYPADTTRPPLDEYQLTDHLKNWKTDLELAADLGVKTLRYGASWPITHLGVGRYDWRHLDQVVDHAAKLGLQLNLDLVHYGVPPWLPESFADPAYGDAIEEFTGAILGRFHGGMQAITPLNEPLTTASFCGLRKVWPPYLEGWDGWTTVVVPIAKGVVRTIAAARDISPETLIVHVEAATLTTAGNEEATSHTKLLQQIGWLPTDLALGLVNPEHPMYRWLLERGAEEADLAWLENNARTPDIMGVNYYPDLTPRTVLSTGNEHTQVAHNRWDEGLETAVRAFAERYNLPLAITETSIEGDETTRSRWLADSLATCTRLRRENIDLRGYTWWPLFDFVDWSWAAGGANVEEFAIATTSADGTTTVAPAAPLGNPDHGKSAFLRRMGLVQLNETQGGDLLRHPLKVATEFSIAASAKEEQ